MSIKTLTPQNGVRFWHHIRLVPLFSSILGGILLLFALCIGFASFFLIQGDRALQDVTEEIQVRMGLADSANHLRTARINLINAGAASRVADMDQVKQNVANAEGLIKPGARLASAPIWREK